MAKIKSDFSLDLEGCFTKAFLLKGIKLSSLESTQFKVRHTPFKVLSDARITKKFEAQRLHFRLFLTLSGARPSAISPLATC